MNEEMKLKYICPACKNQTLFIDSSGGLTCSLIGCKNPLAFDEQLKSHPEPREGMDINSRNSLAEGLQKIHSIDGGNYYNMADYILSRFTLPAEVKWPKYKKADGVFRQPKCAASWNLAVDVCKQALENARKNG